MAPVVIDIYHGDSVIDFARVKSSGIVGVIHKASQGGETVDRAYASRRKMAERAGLLWGAYHFFDFTAPPEAQAEHFLSVAEPDAHTLVALDWESIGRSAPSVQDARSFLERVTELLNRRAVIYSGNVAKEQIVGKDAFFGAHRLWLAEYGERWSVQESWSAPWLWQQNGDSYGPGPHRIPGIDGLCDNDTIVAPMTVDQLKAEWAS
jgi:GH25 family lysozyme M1 (1,4-beta-N-acetylmuramidase)